MPARGKTVWGAPCWADLGTSDPAQAAQFYANVFGWEAIDQGEEHGHYVLFQHKGKNVGGMMLNPSDSGTSDGWTNYLASSDTTATAQVISDTGGLILMDPTQVMSFGTMAIVTDPGGAVLGLWQEGTHHGFEIVGEASTPVWHELHTRHYGPAVEFYRTVFGWEMESLSDTSEFRYSRLVHNGEQLAGIMDGSRFLPEDAPSSWHIYFGAEDVDATVAKVVEQGGAILQPVEETPYGKLAQVADTTGAAFKLASV